MPPQIRAVHPARGLSHSAGCAVVNRLDRHAARRRQGIPTLSLLLGPRETALSHWRAWAAAGECLCGEARADLPASVAATLCACVTGAPLGRDVLLRWCAEQGGWEEPEVLDGDSGLRTGYLARLKERIPEGPAASLALGAFDAGAAPDPIRVAGGIHAVIPRVAYPAVCLLPGAPGRDALHSALRLAGAMLNACPELPLAVQGEEGSWRRLRTHAYAGRALALAQAGEVDCAAHGEPVPGDTPRRTVPRGIAHTREWLQLLECAQGKKGLVRALERAEQAAGHKPDASGIHPDARSAAEDLLYRALEANPGTRGRFRLNENVDLYFESKRRMEIDLLANHTRLAIEVDGPHHFEGPERYRRDREKDRVLQRGGYLVLRYLAEDIAPRLEHIVQQVEDYLRYREGAF